MKYYCDACTVITLFQDGNLGLLSQYKDRFYISKTQVEGELLKPIELKRKAEESLTLIEDSLEVMDKAVSFMPLYSGLSSYDCLAMAHCLVGGYCLVSDDKPLIMKCKIHHIQTKSCKEIVEELQRRSII